MSAKVRFEKSAKKTIFMLFIINLTLGMVLDKLIQKSYQFINVDHGLSHSHKTTNTFLSFDSVAQPVNWNVYIGLRDAITSQLT